MKIFNYLIDNKMVASAKELCTTINIFQTNLWRYRENDRVIPINSVIKLLTTFEIFNGDWLLTGEGAMLKKGNSHSEAKAIQPSPSVTTEVVLVPHEQEDLITVPMVNQRAAANYLAGHNTQEYYEHLDSTMMPRYMARGGTHVWLQVEGDSMETTLYDGDWLLCEQLSRDRWANIRDYDICVVVTNKRGVQVKRIKNRLNDGFIRCRSDNRKHKPYSVQYEDILEIWRVKYNLTNYMPNRSEELYNKVDYLEEQQEDLRNMVENLMAQLKKGTSI